MKAMVLASTLVLLVGCGADYTAELVDFLDELNPNDGPGSQIDAGCHDAELPDADGGGHMDAGADVDGGTADMATIQWVDWISHDQDKSTVVGSTGTVDVEFVGQTISVLLGTETEPNYWIPFDAYVSSLVMNPPEYKDVVRLVGGDDQVYVLEFSQPVTDPIMAIVSLGSPTAKAEYHFNVPFNIVSYGPSPWGNGYMTQRPGYILEGYEGSGVVQFLGTYSRIEWTAPTYENWHGITVGIVK